MSEATEKIETKSEEKEELDDEHQTISLDVEEGKPQKIDFSQVPQSDDDELMSAIILLAGRNDTGDKGPLTLRVEYKDVENIDDPENSPIITKKETIATFEEGDYEQREIHLTFTSEHEAVFSVEGKGSCTVIGCFSPLVDDEEEEEEEEEEAKEEGK